MYFWFSIFMLLHSSLWSMVQSYPPSDNCSDVYGNLVFYDEYNRLFYIDASGAHCYYQNLPTYQQQQNNFPVSNDHLDEVRGVDTTTTLYCPNILEDFNISTLNDLEEMSVDQINRMCTNLTTYLKKIRYSNVDSKQKTKKYGELLEKLCLRDCALLEDAQRVNRLSHIGVLLHCCAQHVEDKQLQTLFQKRGKEYVENALRSQLLKRKRADKLIRDYFPVPPAPSMPSQSAVIAPKPMQLSPLIMHRPELEETNEPKSKSQPEKQKQPKEQEQNKDDLGVNNGEKNKKVPKPEAIAHQYKRAHQLMLQPENSKKREGVTLLKQIADSDPKDGEKRLVALASERMAYFYGEGYKLKIQNKQRQIFVKDPDMQKKYLRRAAQFGSRKSKVELIPLLRSDDEAEERHQVMMQVLNDDGSSNIEKAIVYTYHANDFFNVNNDSNRCAFDSLQKAHDSIKGSEEIDECAPFLNEPFVAWLKANVEKWEVEVRKDIVAGFAVDQYQLKKLYLAGRFTKESDGKKTLKYIRLAGDNFLCDACLYLGTRIIDEIPVHERVEYFMNGMSGLAPNKQRSYAEPLNRYKKLGYLKPITLCLQKEKNLDKALKQLVSQKSFQLQFCAHDEGLLRPLKKNGFFEKLEQKSKEHWIAAVLLAGVELSYARFVAADYDELIALAERAKSRVKNLNNNVAQKMVGSAHGTIAQLKTMKLSEKTVSLESELTELRAIVDLFKEAIRLHPKDDFVRLNYNAVLLNLIRMDPKTTEQCLKDQYRLISEETPYVIEAYLSLIPYYVRNKKIDKALELLEQCKLIASERMRVDVLDSLAKQKAMIKAMIDDIKKFLEPNNETTQKRDVKSLGEKYSQVLQAKRLIIQIKQSNDPAQKDKLFEEVKRLVPIEGTKNVRERFVGSDPEAVASRNIFLDIIGKKMLDRLKKQHENK